MHLVYKKAEDEVLLGKPTQELLPSLGCGRFWMHKDGTVCPTESFTQCDGDSLALVVEPHELPSHGHGEHWAPRIVELLADDERQGHADNDQPF